LHTSGNAYDSVSFLFAESNLAGKNDVGGEDRTDRTDSDTGSQWQSPWGQQAALTLI